MKKYREKMIAPILITVIVVIYFFFYFGIFITLVENMAAKVVLAIVPALLAVTMVGVCIQRIREIKGGEEDDLSKY